MTGGGQEKVVGDGQAGERLGLLDAVEAAAAACAGIRQAAAGAEVKGDPGRGGRGCGGQGGSLVVCIRVCRRCPRNNNFPSKQNPITPSDIFSFGKIFKHADDRWEYEWFLKVLKA